MSSPQEILLALSGIAATQASITATQASLLSGMKALDVYSSGVAYSTYVSVSAIQADCVSQRRQLAYLGKYGGSYVTGTGTFVGNYCSIFALETTILGPETSGTFTFDEPPSGGSSLGFSGASIPSGSYLHGDFSQVQLLSGRAVLYNCSI